MLVKKNELSEFVCLEYRADQMQCEKYLFHHRKCLRSSFSAARYVHLTENGVLQALSLHWHGNTAPRVLVAS